MSLWKFLIYMFYYYVLLSNFKMYGQKRQGPNWRNVAKRYKLIFITEKNKTLTLISGFLKTNQIYNYLAITEDNILIC